MSDQELAKFLAPRQKRLQYWKQSFSAEKLSEGRYTEVQGKLSTYGLLLAKLATPASEAELAESRERLMKLEAELNSLFERSRYTTSDLFRRGGVDTLIHKPKE